MKTSNFFLELTGCLEELRISRTGERRLNYPVHFHPVLELVYCHSGQVAMYLGRETYHLQKGSLAVISPMVPHGFSCQGQCDCGFIHIPEKTFLQLESGNRLIGDPGGYVLDGKQAPIGELFHTVFQYIKEQDQQLASLYAIILLTLCARQTEADTVQPAEGTYALHRELLSYIQTNYRQEISLEGLCKQFSIGKSTASKIINTYFHASLPELLNKYRMWEAGFLLRSTQLPVTEIAEKVGYNSLCCFNRNFQKHFGLSPRQYRKV